MSDEINEITEGHSDYKPADTRDENVKHQLTGMYQNWFLDYASYVILERAVPHINDGLKPVQRRILHSMKRLDDGRYNKVANIVGHTMQFHPHGDASIGSANWFRIYKKPLGKSLSHRAKPECAWCIRGNTNCHADLCGVCRTRISG